MPRGDQRPFAWTYAGGPSLTFAMVGDILFGLGSDRKVWMNRDGTAWTEVGGPVEWIYGSTGTRLCARIPDGWGAACYDVNTLRWTVLGQP